MGFQAWVYEGVDSLEQQGAISRRAGFLAWGQKREKRAARSTLKDLVASWDTWTCCQVNRPVADLKRYSILRELPTEVRRCTNKGQQLAVRWVPSCSAREAQSKERAEPSHRPPVGGATEEGLCQEPGRALLRRADIASLDS